MNRDEQTLLDAARRVEIMVGRRKDLKAIQQAIEWKANDRRCRVVLVTGPGGIGKSRLLEEVQQHYAYPTRRKQEQEDKQMLPLYQEASVEDNVTVSDVIDMMDIRLSVRTRMLQALRNALAWPGGVDFDKHSSAMREFLRAVEISASFQTIKDLGDNAERAFWEDFEEHAREKRIVLLIDTAERLVLRSSDWLIQRKLLKPDEMILSSQEWLLKQMSDGRLSNTTLVIAGRDGDDEGKPFFERLRALRKSSGNICRLTEVELKPFTEEETFTYFDYLSNDWQKRSQLGECDASASVAYKRVSRAMQAVARDREGIQVLHQMTGGRPVLLSLYGDLVLETEQIPAPLQYDIVQSQQAVQARGVKALQAEIEQAFIQLFFQQPGLRAQIMQALARCPAGLNARQLHFLIDSDIETELSKWEENARRVEDINGHLEQIRRLSLARPRPNDRLGLQDEIYRIYAERMSDTEDLTTFERNMRAVQYDKLSQWAGWQLQQLREEMRTYLDKDQYSITEAIRTPEDSLRPRISSPLPSVQDVRSEVQRSIWDWELEQLHYDLLRNPTGSLNNDYIDLAERRFHSGLEELDFIVQQEMWRVLHDDHALRFTAIHDERLINRAGGVTDGGSPKEEKDFEEAIKVLRRMALEEDPARWIKRFILRRQFDRAIQFYRAVEMATRDDDNPENTWQHPLNTGERKVWRDYAKISSGRTVTKAISDLNTTLRQLALLTTKSMDEMVEPLGVAGFRGHPALPRIYRILAVGHNFSGYGNGASLGKFDEARVSFGESLLFARLVSTETRKMSTYTRASQEQLEAQQATTRNNLGRALASLGREERGYRVCVDALNLRRRLGAEFPIAYSLNTLALINNSMQRTPTAWREAAQAAAIFRRAGENRGLGLALIQLGIGLRRLANSRDPLVTLDVTQEKLYVLAGEAVGEAVDIFKKDPEVLRLVEATLEYGCVMRDLMRFLDSGEANYRSARELGPVSTRFGVGSPALSTQKRVDLLYRDAEINLKQAVELAEKHGFRYLALQAQVDLAWTHFFAGNYNTATVVGKQAEKRIPKAYVISKSSFPSSKAVESHYFYQLAKLHGLYAGIDMVDFSKRRETLRQKSAIWGDLYASLPVDDDAASRINSAAEHYVLALFYGQLYSPRSRSLVITFDQIYDHVKEFNSVEYEMFYKAQNRSSMNYQHLRSATKTTTGITPFDFSKLEDWLDDCFGPLTHRTDAIETNE